MTAAAGEYDVFISYARKDNVPIGDAPEGWVSAVVRLIQEDQLRFGRPFRIFMDTSEITLRQDWEQRLRGALRTSKVLIVFVSPNYFASRPCRWEWEEHLLRRERLQSLFGWDADDDRPEQAVFLVETPASDHAETEAWRAQVMATHGVEIRDWFAAGASEAQLEQVRASVDALGSSTFERVHLARASAATLGNVRAGTEFFVGRTEPMRLVREALTGAYSLGVVTAVHSLGGLGKTELAVMYANSNRGKYAAGVWMVGSEGQSSLYAVLAQLASVPAFGLSVEPGLAADVVGELVWDRLRTSAAPDRKSLVVLDNVSDPSLLSPVQLAPLGLSGVPDVHLLATTRLGPNDFPASRSSLGFIPLPAMSEDEGLALIAMHLPGEQFESSAERESARALVADLGGLTLAIEQVAVFLAMNPGVPVAAIHDELRRNGLRSLDALLEDSSAAGAILHQGKTLDAVLRTTLAGLDEISISTLHLAACLPPDEIPWAWLQTLASAKHPEELGGESLSARAAWGRNKRLLLSRSLLTDTDVPGIARMHRLIGEWLRSERSHAGSAQLVLDHLVTVGEGLHFEAQTNPPECSALATAILGIVAGSPRVATRFNIPGLFHRLPHYVADGRPLVIAQHVRDAMEANTRTDPSNRGAQRDLTVSLDNVAGLLKYTDPAAALTHYQQSLTLRQHLADTDPSNREGQRDLTVSLNNVAGLLKYTDPAAALTHYQQSLTITQHLADTDPSNLQARRDVMVTVFSMAELTNRVGDERAPDLARDAVAIAEHLASTRRDRASFTDLTAVLDGAAKIIEASSPDEAAQLRERRDAVRAALDAS